jgi:hypothetical protein
VSGKIDARILVEQLDKDRDRGLIAPDKHFVWKRITLCVCEDATSNADRRGWLPGTKVKDVMQRALLELLRNHQRLGIPLSQYTLDSAADELERLWWPDPKAEKHWLRLMKAKQLRKLLENMETKNRQRGVPRPRSAAKDEIAQEFGHSSGEALRKHLQPARVNRPRPKPRG